MAFDKSLKLRDRELERKGVWMDYDDDTRFLIARKNNQDYKTFISKTYRDNEKAIISKTNTRKADEIADKFMLEGTAKHLLRDWEGMLSAGKPIKYSVEAAMAVLEEHDDLREMIEEFAENRENYIVQQDLADAENLGE